MFEDLSPEEITRKMQHCPSINYSTAKNTWRAKIPLKPHGGKGSIEVGEFDTFEEAVLETRETADRWRLACSDWQLFGHLAVCVDGRVGPGPDDAPMAPVVRAPKVRRATGRILGVAHHRKSGGWQATLQVDGKRKHLGFFKTYDEAVAARRRAEDEAGLRS